MNEFRPYYGLPFVTKRRPVLSFLHIYCDESGKHKGDPVVCFAALCIRVEALADFDSKWKSLLRQYDLAELHMVEVSRLSKKVGSKFRAGQTGLQRVELLKPFADCVNDFMETGLVSVWDSAGFASMSAKLLKALADLKDPYHLAFIRGLEEVARYGKNDDQICMVCDDDQETAWDCYRIYRSLRKPSRNVREKLKSLSFADSIAFPALQAADMTAWLSRKEGELRWRGKPYDFRNLLSYMTDRELPPGKMNWRSLFADADLLKKSKNWRTK